MTTTTAAATTADWSFANLLQKLDVSQRELARGVQRGAATISRLVRDGVWPKRRPERLQKRVIDFLTAQGATAEQLEPLISLTFEQKNAPADGGLTEATSETKKETEGDDMLLHNVPLTQAAKKHFGLVRSPFSDDVQCRDDVYHTAAVRFCRAALLDAANNHGFMALIGESGAGKTTLVEELEERLREERGDVVVIKPYVLGMEANDSKGKTLKVGQIADAIIYALDPATTPRRTLQARFRQMHNLLLNSRRVGTRHVLVIEEAHCLPIPTLKHLKRLLELKDGMKKLIGIALIGQPELRNILHSHNPEVREVMQRCEVYELEPLDSELEKYVAHKLERTGVDVAQVFDADAFDAMRQRLIRTPRGSKRGAVSICYPLAVHNLLCRAMNATAATGFDKVNADIVAGC